MRKGQSRPRQYKRWPNADNRQLTGTKQRYKQHTNHIYRFNLLGGGGLQATGYSTVNEATWLLQVDSPVSSHALSAQL